MLPDCVYCWGTGHFNTGKIPFSVFKSNMNRYKMEMNMMLILVNVGRIDTKDMLPGWM